MRQICKGSPSLYEKKEYSGQSAWMQRLALTLSVQRNCSFLLDGCQIFCLVLYAPGIRSKIVSIILTLIQENNGNQLLVSLSTVLNAINIEPCLLSGRRVKRQSGSSMNTFQKLAQLSGGSYINTTKGNIGQVANLLKVC